MEIKNIELITASAGSGKTHSLKENLKDYISGKKGIVVRPNAIIATTFTKKAALELKERAIEGLYAEGLYEAAGLFNQSLVSTVHSICFSLIEKYCFEIGISPVLNIISEDDEEHFFSAAIAEIVDLSIEAKFSAYSQALGFGNGGEYSREWREDLRDILGLIHQNKYSKEQFLQNKKENEAFIRSLLPLPSDNFDSDLASLISALEGAINDFNSQGDDLASTDKKSLPNLKMLLTSLKNKSPIVWDKLFSLAKPSKGSFTNGGHEIMARLSPYASSLVQSKKFLEQYISYHNDIFDLALMAVEKYETFKKERGLVDYIDLEVLASRLLDTPSVAEKIKNDFDLLLVDEFQDTSPIQLSIFLKISQLVKKSIWVGDPKQSIYAFRGSAPELMTSLVDEIKKTGAISSLDTSYRSRKKLVEFSNSLSTKIFSSSLDPSMIVLKPHFEEKKSDAQRMQEALNVIKTKAPPKKEISNDMLFATLAHATRDILSKNLSVRDKLTSRLRPLKAGDIAILCTTNKNAEKIANNLNLIGIESAIERKNLLSTLEGSLVFSCLSFLVYHTNDLNKCEIVLLSDTSVSVEDLLKNRLLFLEELEKELHQKNDWQKEHPWIAELLKIKFNSEDLTVSEIIEKVFINLSLHSHVSLWGNEQQRKANLDQILTLSQKYTESQLRLKLPCTLQGFLMWITNKNDLQAKALGENAVNIVTYHSSKGLEWPLVILADLDSQSGYKGFGISSFVSANSANFAELIKNRSIRFMVNPTHPSRKNTWLIDAFSKTNFFKQGQKNALEERGRLLYVGYTRARDYLYLNLEDNDQLGFSWIDEVLSSQSQKLHYNLAENSIEGHSFSSLSYPAKLELVNNALPRQDVAVLKPFIMDRPSLPPYRINPSKLESSDLKFKIKEYRYGQQLEVTGSPDDEELGNCLHNILATPRFDVGDIRSIIENYGLSHNLKADKVAEQSRLFFSLLEKDFLGFTFHHEWPIQKRYDGKLYSGIVDLWGQKAEQVLIIDHKSYQGVNLEAKCREYLSQLEVYRNLLALDSRIFINFFSKGVLVELLIEV